MEEEKKQTIRVGETGGNRQSCAAVSKARQEEKKKKTLQNYRVKVKLRLKQTGGKEQNDLAQIHITAEVGKISIFITYYICYM